jgi:L-fucose isomerase-like protein
VIDDQSRAADEAERTVAYERRKAAVVRALALWETWIVMASLGYLVCRFWPWAQAGFPVVGR